MRTHCDCGELLSLLGAGSNWGDLRCENCGAQYCQDCGAILWAEGCSELIKIQEQDEEQ